MNEETLRACEKMIREAGRSLLETMAATDVAAQEMSDALLMRVASLHGDTYVTPPGDEELLRTCERSRAAFDYLKTLICNIEVRFRQDGIGGTTPAVRVGKPRIVELDPKGARRTEGPLQ